MEKGHRDLSTKLFQKTLLNTNETSFIDQCRHLAPVFCNAYKHTWKNLT
jgi:hypothetical protein